MCAVTATWHHHRPTSTDHNLTVIHYKADKLLHDLHDPVAAAQ
ncbi:hypothetical protein ACU8KH_01620 [Lachancea thermotolerans]